MNSTSLDINVSETLANKTLIVTTILVSFLCRGLEMWRQSVSWSGLCCLRQDQFFFAKSAVAVAVTATDRALSDV